MPDAEQAAARAHVLGVIRAFEELGWEVRRYIVGDHLRRGWVGAGSEATVSRNALTRLGADLTRMILGPVNARRAWRELGGSVDWVYERASLFARLGAPFSRRGIPWILETQSLRYRENPAVLRTSALASLGRRHEIAAYRRCDVVVAVSERLKDLIVSEANVDPGKVLVIRNAADADRFDPRRYPVRPPGDPPVIGFVGRLSAWQGLEELLECVALVSRSGIPFRLVVVGDGPLRGTLEQKARDLGLAGQVRFVGAVPWEETPRLIATFDLGFLGHRSIPGAGAYHSPLKLYEYMAMAKPVIASRTEDARLLVREGETGFLFDPGDAGSLVAALHAASAARPRLPDMGRRARDAVLAHHTWRARVEQLVEGVREILGREARP